jgi:hypothetical protein
LRIAANGFPHSYRDHLRFGRRHELENFGSGKLQPEKCFPVKAAGFQGEALEE